MILWKEIDTTVSNRTITVKFLGFPSTPGIFYCMKYKDWSDFRLHCSGIDEMMTLPKSCTNLTKAQTEKYNKLVATPNRNEKEEATFEVLFKKRQRFLDPELSETAKKYLIRRYATDKYNKRRAVASLQKPAITKGVALEDEAMQMISRLHKIEYCRQKDAISNDFLHGKCDILCEAHKKVVEMKISWSADSFFPYLHTGLPPSVWYQTQGYLDLYNLDHAQVCYVLVNTPKHLIEQEIANTFRRYSFGEITREKFDEKMEQAAGFYNYDNISLRRRVITFEVARYPEIMTAIRRKVDLGREWLADFDKTHMHSKNVLTLPENYCAISKESDIEPDPSDPREGDEG